MLADAAQQPAALRPQVYVLDYLGALLDAHRAHRHGAHSDGSPDLIVASAYGPHETPDVLAALADELTRRQAEAVAARRTRTGTGPRRLEGLLAS